MISVGEPNVVVEENGGYVILKVRNGAQYRCSPLTPDEANLLAQQLRTAACDAQAKDKLLAKRVQS